MRFFELPPLAPPLSIVQNDFGHLVPQEESLEILGAFYPQSDNAHSAEAIVVRASKTAFEYRSMAVAVAPQALEITLPNGKPFSIYDMNESATFDLRRNVLSEEVGRLLFEQINPDGIWRLSCPETPGLSILRPRAFNVFTDRVMQQLNKKTNTIAA